MMEDKHAIVDAFDFLVSELKEGEKENPTLNCNEFNFTILAASIPIFMGIFLDIRDKLHEIKEELSWIEEKIN